MLLTNRSRSHAAAAPTTVMPPSAIAERSAIPESEMETEILVHSPQSRHMVARWEVIDSQLTCTWVKE